MVNMKKWLDRKFESSPPVGEFPMIVERLRGAPTRVEEKAELYAAIVTERIDNAWSIQENIGHLLDLEPLWMARLGDLLEGKPDLRAADLSNRVTNEADHNAKKIDMLTQGFRAARQALVDRLDGLDDGQVATSARHPRLKRPMRTIDLCYFVAEHDDHHLALMTRIAAAIGKR